MSDTDILCLILGFQIGAPLTWLAYAGSVIAWRYLRGRPIVWVPVFALGVCGQAWAADCEPAHEPLATGCPAEPTPWKGSPTFTGPVNLGPGTGMWFTFPAAGVSLGPNGEVKIDGKHDLDTTARQFWNAVARVRGQPEPFPTSPSPAPDR